LQRPAERRCELQRPHRAYRRTAAVLEFDAVVIASGDPTDLVRLAAPYRQISLMRL
jgi:hypothetical protein